MSATTALTSVPFCFNTRVSPTMTALPEVSCVLKVMRTTGVVSLVAAMPVATGASGAMVSRNWLWAALMSPSVTASPILVEASAILLCCSADKVMLVSMLLTVLESARLMTVPLVLDAWIELARLSITVPPPEASPLVARVTTVATCAAAFCAVTSLATIGS